MNVPKPFVILLSIDIVVSVKSLLTATMIDNKTPNGLGFRFFEIFWSLHHCPMTMKCFASLTIREHGKH